MPVPVQNFACTLAASPHGRGGGVQPRNRTRVWADRFVEYCKELAHHPM